MGYPRDMKAVGFITLLIIPGATMAQAILFFRGAEATNEEANCGR